MGDATIGGWWRARDTATTSDFFPAGPSTATHVLTGDVYGVDLQWSGGAGPGIASIRIFDPLSGLTHHQSTFPAIENIQPWLWVACPPGVPGDNMVISPEYSLVAPGLLEIGPGAERGGGMGRESFCNDPNVPDEGNPSIQDPLYFKAFSDFTGYFTIVPGVEEYVLDLHVRGLDHG